MYRKCYEKLSKFNNGVMWLEKWLSIILFVILLFCLSAQVIARFILKIPAVWTEEMARYTFIMAMWVACGFTLHLNKHVNMDLLDTFLAKTKNPKKTFWIMEKVTMVANLLFTGYFISIYHPFLLKMAKVGKMMTTVKVPIWVAMSAVEIGFILMFWHSLVICLKPYDGDAKAESAKTENA